MGHSTTLAGAGIAHALHAIGTTMGEIFGSLTRILTPSRGIQTRVHRMEDLASKSDMELARMGLNRADIARLVFRDGGFL